MPKSGASERFSASEHSSAMHDVRDADERFDSSGFLASRRLSLESAAVGSQPYFRRGARPREQDFSYSRSASTRHWPLEGRLGPPRELPHVDEAGIAVTSAARPPEQVYYVQGVFVMFIFSRNFEIIMFISDVMMLRNATVWNSVFCDIGIVSQNMSTLVPSSWHCLASGPVS